MTYNSTLSVVLALMVFNYGTHLAPQLAMGPESIAYKGIEVEGYRDFLWIKRSSRVTTGYQSRVMMVARSMLGMDVYNGLMWLPRAPLRAAKTTFRALYIPYKWVTKSWSSTCSSENNGSTGLGGFPDLGAGTPPPRQHVEAAGCAPNTGLKAEEFVDCRNGVLNQLPHSAPLEVPSSKETAKQPGASGLGVNDCWAGIDTENMRVIDGSLKQELDSAFMVAEVEDDEIDLDGSQGEESGPPDPPFFDSATGEEPIQPGRPTDVYVPSQEPDSPSVIDQLREALSNGSFDGGTVEVDAAAVQKILGQIRDGEAQVMDLEQRYQELLEEQDILEDVRSVASDESQSQAAIAEALAKVAEVLAETHKKPQFGSNWGYSISKSLGDVKLDMLSEAEHGQMHVWEAWLKSTKLKLKQKGTGLAELLETAHYKEESAGHSQQLTAAMMRCFEEGTRVWDIATTAIQEHGERADLVVAAIESEVGRGELFRAFRYTVEFFEDHWLRHDAPWGTGLAVTLSHLQLLRTRLNKEKLTVDQLMVLRVAFLLPERFSWLQREIFKSEHMTVEKLMEALKPHVKAGVLADSQSYKHKAVGAAGVSSDGGNATKRESKALAAVTRQNRELSKEIAQLKQAQPERPTSSKGKGSKGSKGKRSGYGKGGKGGKNNSSTFTVQCAHPQCTGEHFLKHCPKMQGIGSEEFRKQYKQYMDSLWQKKNTEKGAGQAAVELQQ